MVVYLYKTSAVLWLIFKLEGLKAAPSADIYQYDLTEPKESRIILVS